MRKRQDDLTVEEFIDLAGLIVKTYLQKTCNKKIVHLKKKSEETREKIQNQQYWKTRREESIKVFLFCYFKSDTSVASGRSE